MNAVLQELFNSKLQHNTRRASNLSGRKGYFHVHKASRKWNPRGVCEMSANSQLPGRGGRQYSYLICGPSAGSLTNFKERVHGSDKWHFKCQQSNKPCHIPLILSSYAYRDIHTYGTFCNITLMLNKYTYIVLFSDNKWSYLGRHELLFKCWDGWGNQKKGNLKTWS